MDSEEKNTEEKNQGNFIKKPIFFTRKVFLIVITDEFLISEDDW